MFASPAKGCFGFGGSVVGGAGGFFSRLRFFATRDNPRSITSISAFAKGISVLHFGQVVSEAPISCSHSGQICVCGFSQSSEHAALGSFVFAHSGLCAIFLYLSSKNGTCFHSKTYYRTFVCAPTAFTRFSFWNIFLRTERKFAMWANSFSVKKNSLQIT
jgi:hypothetical protein